MVRGFDDGFWKVVGGKSVLNYFAMVLENLVRDFSKIKKGAKVELFKYSGLFKNNHFRNILLFGPETRIKKEISKIVI